MKETQTGCKMAREGSEGGDGKVEKRRPEAIRVNPTKSDRIRVNPTCEFLTFKGDQKHENYEMNPIKN
jgi:hypothetical protein